MVYTRIFDGTLRKGDAIQFMATDKQYFAEEIGVLRMGMEAVDALHAGEVGYIIGSVKDVRDTQVGDTVTTCATRPMPLSQGSRGQADGL